MSTTFGAEAGRAVEVGRAAGTAPTISCPTCEEQLLGEYCHRCGERRADARDLAVRHFAAEAARELTSLDSKLTRTVRALLFRPGFLTLEWLAGRRRRYLKPLNLCLGIFALNLFAYSVYKPISRYDLGNIIESQPAAAKPIGQLLDKWSARKGMTREALIGSINDKWQKHMSLLQLLVILSLAAVLHLAFLLRRYFVVHLVFSMHFLSFTFLLVVLLWPLYLVMGVSPTPRTQLLMSGVWLVFVAYVFFAARAVYGLRRAKALLLSLTVFAGYFVSYVLVYITSLVVAVVHAVKS